jgi:type IV secretion system protein VirB1
MKRTFVTILVALTGPLYAGPSGTSSTQLTPVEFQAVVARCAPGAAFDTMLAVATTESALYINAISLNRPIQVAHRFGYSHSRIELSRQPKDKDEALRWLHWFAAHGYTVSVGLMQINIENGPRFGVRPEQLLEPCTNITIGATLLAQIYGGALAHSNTPDQAILDALSVYNSGSYERGYTNGYVASVLRNHARK